MKVNIKSLMTKPHTKKEFRLQEAGNPELLSDIGGCFLEPVMVDLVIENTGQVFIASGTVQTMIKLVCSRCLEEINFSIKSPFYVTIMQGTLPAENSAEDDDFLVVAADGEVDISTSVNEAIYLTIPLVPLCREDCQGICPVCGVNKNIENCHCLEEVIDPRWEKLKNLK
ncbi:MAG: YceD family protein [Syntrophomonadaceae bacterium]|jgi:uncharacterized protein